MKNFFNSIGEGFADIKLVLNDGKAAVFARPFIAALILCFAVYTYMNNGKKVVARQKGEIASLQAQKAKMSGYTANKRRVLELEKFFADPGAGKNEWLVTRIIDNFQNNGVRYNFTGTQTEDSTEILTLASMGVTFKTDYGSAVKIVMDFENYDKFMKVQEFIFSKDDKELGSNNFSMKLSAAFLKDRTSGPDGGGQ